MNLPKDLTKQGGFLGARAKKKLAKKLMAKGSFNSKTIKPQASKIIVSNRKP